MLQPFFDWFGSNVIPNATVMFWMIFLTLVLTGWGANTARNAFRHQVAMVEPWSLTKIKEDVWLLERNSPSLVTIHGAIGGFEGVAGNGSIDRKTKITFMTRSGEPGRYFKKGTKILVQIEETLMGGSFHLYYEERKKETDPPILGYHDLSTIDFDTQVPPRGVKKWNTPIY